MPNSWDEQEPESGPENEPDDPAAWRALAVAAGLGIPAAALMALSVLVETLARGSCRPEPGRVCHGLTTNGLHAGWIFGVLGFGGPLTVLLTRSRVGNRAWRWFWAWAAVLLPVLTMVVALEVSRHA